MARMATASRPYSQAGEGRDQNDGQAARRGHGERRRAADRLADERDLRLWPEGFSPRPQRRLRGLRDRRLGRVAVGEAIPRIFRGERADATLT